MTKPKKKPKTGDVVGWAVLDVDGDARGDRMYESRDLARRKVEELKEDGDLYGPYRLAKIVLAK